MIKKILICLCAFLLVMSAAAGSVAEVRAAEETDGLNTVIYYVPATKNNAVTATAKSIGRAIISFRQGTTTVQGGRYQSANALTQDFNEDKLKKLFATGNDTGNSKLKCMPSDYAQTPYEVWFIVPGDAFDNLIMNTDLMEACQEILKTERSVLHFIFITDKVKAIPGESALGQLAAQGKTDWIFTLSDYRQESLPGNTDRELHTASYLLASLLGEPADLKAEQNEGSWTYQLPAEARVLVLVDWNEKKPGMVEVRNAAGSPCNTEEVFSTAEVDFATRTGTVVPRMEIGDYTVSVSSGTAKSVKVYWYPNLNNMEPAFKLEEVWQRGTNNIVLSMGGTIGKPEQYDVRFSYRDNEDEKTATGLIGSYNEVLDAWDKKVTVGTGVQHVYIEATVEMKMTDGNRIREWKVPQVMLDVQTAGVSRKSETLSEATLYTDNTAGTAASVEYSWDEFFRYNAEDHPTFTIAAAEAEIAEKDVTEKEATEEEVTAEDEAAGEEQKEPAKKDPGIAFENLGNEKGFRITAKNGGNLADTLTVILQGSVTGEDGQEITSEEKKITFTRRDVSTLFSGISFSAETADEDTETVIAGKELTVKAVIPEDMLADWRAACEQLSSFPKPENLLLFCALGNNGQFGEGTAFDGETMEAASTLKIPALTEAGQVTIRTAIRAEGSEKNLITEQLTAGVQNNPPIPADASVFEEQKKLTLTGWPWKYDEMDLLTACFKTNQPFKLFSDDADNLTKVTLEIENAEGLELPDGFELNKEGTVWTMEVLDAEDVVPIRVAHSSILAILDHHTIRLIPTDGVNNTEEPFEVYEVGFQVFSEYMTYASYAIAGLVLLLILLLIIRIIRQAVKPSFESISIRCYASSDEDQEEIAEIMNKSNPIPMYGFKKKPVSLATVLILSRQPALGSEYAGAAKDIQILPAKHNGLTVLFGKEALKAIGRHEKKETIAFGKSFRMRIGNQYILIENVQPGS